MTRNSLEIQTRAPTYEKLGSGMVGSRRVRRLKVVIQVINGILLVSSIEPNVNVTHSNGLIVPMYICTHEKVTPVAHTLKQEF